jgi:hypothetical protein
MPLKAREMGIMNLEHLRNWTKEMLDKGTLRPLVRKDKNGNPMEGDIISAITMIREIGKRIDDAVSFDKKSKKCLENITEYLAFLEKRGIAYKEPGKKDKSSFPEEKILDTTAETVDLSGMNIKKKK